MQKIKLFLKKFLIPKSLFKFAQPYWHGSLAWLGSVWFRHPSYKLIVIGVTGTNGKSTTVNLIAAILEQAGYKTGFTSTVNCKIGSQEFLNTMKMTMPSGWLLHKWMRHMVDADCRYAVLEISSEGLAQNRHLGINFDVAVFTNLTSEHIESHGGFENYKKAKGKLFGVLEKFPITMDKHRINPELQKTIITNSDDDYSAYFSKFGAKKKITYGIQHYADYQAKDIDYLPAGVAYSLTTTHYALHLKGRFDVYNSLCAIATTASQGISLEISKQALEKIPLVPGRVEVVQQQPFTVVVDYAYEPEEMRQLYETVQRWPHGKILQVLGPTGGGRDKVRIPVLGKMAAEFADIVFITTDDPYDDNPQDLIHAMADGAVAAGKTIGQNLFRNPDRRGAIARAFEFAQPGDLVLITGKGADQKIAVANGQYVDWDDRLVAREELEKARITK